MAQHACQLNRSTYDRVASQYAELNAAMPAAVEEQASRLLAQVSTGERILDLGCGAGRDLAWFVKHGAQLVGADLSAGMLRQARIITSAALCLMDMRRLGFASGVFRAVWCSAALLHLPKAEVPQTLAEIARVFAPGGLFFLSVQQGVGEGEEIGPYPGEVRFFARFNSDEMACLLEQANFRMITQGLNPLERKWLWFEAVRR